jgi:hypothetical protein
MSEMEQNNFFSILDDTHVILKDFDIEELFKTKRKKNNYYINPNEPGPVDPLRSDF